MAVRHRKLVVLEHDFPFLHWDLLIEHRDRLLAWRLLQPVRSHIWISAERIPDHRLRYLSYEGPVSGHRGQVFQMMNGSLQTGSKNLADADQTGPLGLTGVAEFEQLCGQHLRTSHPEWRFR